MEWTFRLHGSRVPAPPKPDYLAIQIPNFRVRRLRLFDTIRWAMSNNCPGRPPTPNPPGPRDKASRPKIGQELWTTLGRRIADPPES